MRLLVFAAHLISYSITCAYYFTKDLYCLYNSGYKNKRLQLVPSDLFKSWEDAIGRSIINIMVTFIAIMLMPIYEQTFFRTLARLPLYIILIDVCFYITHRIFHANNRLFVLHKEHHICNTVAADGINCSIIEHIFINLMSVYIPYSLLGGHNAFLVFYAGFASYNSASAHSGYEHSKLHNLHHTSWNVNYGTGLYLMDRLFGTYKK